MALSLSDVIKTKKLKKEDKQNENGENFLRKKFAPFQVDPSLEISEKPLVENINTIPETNLSQSEAKVEPELSQSEAKHEPLLKPKLSHNEVEVETNLSQSEAKVEPELQKKTKLQDKVEPQPEPQLETNLSQSEAKVEPTRQLESLTGLQRESLFYIFDSCLKNGSKISGLISISNVALTLKTTTAAARKAIQRLEAKRYISRSSYKDGRGGWTKYEVPHPVYLELLTSQTRANLEPKLSQSEAKVEPQPEPQPEPRLSNSSSIVLNNKNTTTEERPEIRVPENLKGLFSRNELNSLVEKNLLSIDLLQQSLDHFSYDMEHKCVKAKTSPINLFFGLARSGRVYRSLKMLKDETEDLRAYEMEYNKALSENRVLREKQSSSQEENNFAKDLSESSELFQDWFSSTKRDEHLSLVRSSEFCPYGSELYLTVLKAAFVEQVYKKQK